MKFYEIFLLFAILCFSAVNFYYTTKELMKDLKDIKKMKGNNKDV